MKEWEAVRDSDLFVEDMLGCCCLVLMDLEVLNPQLGFWNVELMRFGVLVDWLELGLCMDEGSALRPMYVVGGKASSRLGSFLTRGLFGGSLDFDGTVEEVSIE